jgi:hypothetical protein
VPSGDRSKTWFPEMIHELRRSWRGDLSIDEVIALAQSLDSMLLDIRTRRGIKPPIILCRKCGKHGPAAIPRVSVRATILAARRFAIGSQAEVEALERLWKRHRTREALDLYGRPADANEATTGQETGGCIGHGV